NRFGRNILHLTGAAIKTGQFTAINDIGVQWIGRDIAPFFGGHRLPIAPDDRAVITATGDTGGTALLLRAIYPIWKLIIGDDVIELRGRLIVQTAPGLTAIDRDNHTLIGGQQNDVRIIRIDPEAMIIITAGRAFYRGECLAAITGAIG